MAEQREYWNAHVDCYNQDKLFHSLIAPDTYVWYTVHASILAYGALIQSATVFVN